MLERAVTLEPAFAPAWHALGLRYYDYGTWWGGAEPARQKSLAAHRKALELDPELISAARNIVTHRAEAGDLEGAYHDARRLLEHFGPSADTHFTLSYVYRYGGLLEASQRHCELALDRDPQDPRLRSCGYSYLYAGKLSRVMEFLMLDEGSYFVHWGTVLYHLRLNDRDAALHVTRQAADEPTRRLMQPCLEGARGAALDDAGRRVRSALAAKWRSRNRLRRCADAGLIAAVRRKRCASWNAPWTAASVRTRRSIWIRSGRGCAAIPSSSEFASKPWLATIGFAAWSTPTTSSSNR